MARDQGIRAILGIHSPGQAGANASSDSAPFRFHGVGLGPLFRFFTVTGIVVAVIRRTVTYKKHRVTQMLAWPLCISYLWATRLAGSR